MISIEPSYYIPKISFSSRALIRFVGLMLQVRSHHRNNLNIGDIFRQQVAKHPNKVCFIFENTEWTFAQVSPDHVSVPVKATLSIVDDDNHEL